MDTSAVLVEIEQRIPVADSLDELIDVVARRHRLDSEQRAAAWLLARREAEDPGRRTRAQFARAILRPID